MILKNKPFENIMGKGENAGNQHFLLFPSQNNFQFFSHIYCRRLQMLSIWTGLKYCRFVKSLFWDNTKIKTLPL